MENVRVGVEALRIHPLRTLLSVLGILIGSAALIATMAVSDGIMSFARDQVLRNTSVQVVTVSPKTSIFRDGEWMPNHDYPVFTEADVAGLRRHLEGVDVVALTMGGRASVRLRSVQCRASVVLGSASLMELQSIQLSAGRFFNDREASRNAAVVVLNYALARDLSGVRDPIAVLGRKIHVNGRVRRVIGIEAPTGFEDRGNPSFSLYAPIRSAGALLDPPPDGRYAPTIILRAARVEAVEDVRDAEADWLSRHHARLPQRIQMSVALEELRQVELAFLLVKLFIGALVGATAGLVFGTYPARRAARLSPIVALAHE